MSLAVADITGLLLAGGEGRRMGGVDKGLALLDGQPLAAHVLARLQPQVGGVLISANRHLDAYAALGASVLTDTLFEPDGRHAGPLAGMLAGLRACPTPWLLCVPCDTPFLPLDLAGRLAQAIDAASAPTPGVAWATTPGSASDPARSHPTCCLLRATLAVALQAALMQGERRVERWLRSQRHVEVVFDDVNAFRNLNTPDALRQSATN